MTPSVVWYLSAQPPTRLSPCSSSSPKLSRETSLRLLWKQMKKWWAKIKGWKVHWCKLSNLLYINYCHVDVQLLICNVLHWSVSFTTIYTFWNNIVVSISLSSVCCFFVGHRNQAKVFWHHPCSNSHVCPEDRLSVCVFRVWKPVSLSSFFIIFYFSDLLLIKSKF